MQEVLESYKTVLESEVNEWFKVGKISDFPENSGACIKHTPSKLQCIIFQEQASGMPLKIYVHIKWKWFCLWV